MEHTNGQKNWKPIEGLPKQNRPGPGTKFSKKRADHRNAILKDWGERLEPQIEPKVPIDYKSPFDTDKCAYCLSMSIGPSVIYFTSSNDEAFQSLLRSHQQSFPSF